MKQSIIFSFDCEGTGPNHIRNGLKSVGWVLGTFSGHILEKSRIDFLPMPGQVPDDETFQNFYQKQNPGLWEALTENAVSPDNGMYMFNRKLSEYEEKYNLYILTDAPSFDASLINYYLQYFGYLPLHFTRSGNFRPVHDADSYARGYLKCNQEKIWIDNKKDLNVQVNVQADHYPENDAESIYLYHIGILKK
jgi:hypothetical protein